MSWEHQTKSTWSETNKGPVYMTGIVFWDTVILKLWKRFPQVVLSKVWKCANVTTHVKMIINLVLKSNWLVCYFQSNLIQDQSKSLILFIRIYVDECKQLHLVVKNTFLHRLIIFRRKNRFGKKIKAIWSDRGGEYISHESSINYLNDQGITIQRTTPYLSEQNRVAERKNRTLVKIAICMLEDAYMEKTILGWSDCDGKLSSKSIDLEKCG